MKLTRDQEINSLKIQKISDVNIFLTFQAVHYFSMFAFSGGSSSLISSHNSSGIFLIAGRCLIGL